MDLTTPVQTSNGEVPLQKLLEAYEKKKLYDRRKSEWAQTDAGKEYNRQKAKQYYDRHKAEVLAKRSIRYETDRETLLTRAKEYYALHSEECIRKNRERYLSKVEAQKIEEIKA